ncbi:thiosulfate sulfurtransferase GlpE [Phytohalomonas tamaricis]|uniref:thiosulfate sulfurtransferase GlpE n=1 Tax=Phytohalomonas tamaricis TaxID=2081032 RepID=UPI000D0B347A|nr:thiosulfate sulfurtransferase GlpE [Phytohalomonas tamaricis]
MAFKHLDIKTLSTWLEEGRSVSLVDIRDPLSFANGHIAGSCHLDNTSVAEFVDNTSAEQPVVVVCYHGNSSQQAAAWLDGQGFEHVYSLDGGFTAWQAVHPDNG